MREFQIRLTEPQYEVLKTISELSGDTIDEYRLAVVIQGLQSDIELYLGNSKNVTLSFLKGMYNQEVYDIFRNIFHNEEDALAATIQLFRGDPISWGENYE